MTWKWDRMWCLWVSPQHATVTCFCWPAVYCTWNMPTNSSIHVTTSLFWIPLLWKMKRWQRSKILHFHMELTAGKIQFWSIPPMKSLYELSWSTLQTFILLELLSFQLWQRFTDLGLLCRSVIRSQLKRNDTRVSSRF